MVSVIRSALNYDMLVFSVRLIEQTRTKTTSYVEK